MKDLNQSSFQSFIGQPAFQKALQASFEATPEKHRGVIGDFLNTFQSHFSQMEKAEMQRADDQSLANGYSPTSNRLAQAAQAGAPGQISPVGFSAQPVQPNQPPPSNPLMAAAAGQTLPGGTPGSWFGATPSNGQSGNEVTNDPYGTPMAFGLPSNTRGLYRV